MGLLIGGSIYSYGVVFIFCEFGEQIHSQFDEINDFICELDWFTFPLHIQRMMPMVFLSSQNPAKLSASGGIPCSRPTFKAASFNLLNNF